MNNKELKLNGLIALFPLSFANCAILHPLFFYERFCTLSFANCVLFKIIIKRGGKRQKIGCKIAQKKEEGVQNRTTSKKIGGKRAIEHKVGVQNQKGGKTMGCKIAQNKRRGAKSHN